MGSGEIHYYILLGFCEMKLNQLPEFHSVIYVTFHGTPVSKYLQTYRTSFHLLDLEVPELSPT